jgi:hypothetical protein
VVVADIGAPAISCGAWGGPLAAIDCLTGPGPSPRHEPGEARVERRTEGARLTQPAWAPTIHRESSPWPYAWNSRASLIRELNDYQSSSLREASERRRGGEEVEERDQRRSFPIVIGAARGQAIERRIKGVTIKRPQTHETSANIIPQMGGALKSITITDPPTTRFSRR